MEQGLSGSVDQLLQLGLPGVVIIGLGFFAYRVFKLYTEVQERRIAEARETVKAMEQNTAALESLTAVIQARRT